MTPSSTETLAKGGHPTAFKSLLRNAVSFVFPRAMQRRGVRKWYGAIADLSSNLTGDLSFWFMNFGYVPLGSDEAMPDLTEESPFRFHMHLYWHLASAVDIRDKEVLEVGCGRGGGAYFLMRYMRPAKIIGLDLSKTNVKLAAARFSLDGLSFRQGDAETLPFGRNCFDVVVNVESSHSYPDLERFFRQVARVLRPGGHFLFADFGSKYRMAGIGDQLRQAGFELLRLRNITQNVRKSIELDNPRRERMMRAIAKDEEDFDKLARFGCLVGTERYNRFGNGGEEYWSYVLRKRDGFDAQSRELP